MNKDLVLKLIKKSFDDSKHLLVQRAWLLLFFIFLGLFLYYVFNINSLVFSSVLFIFIDKYLTSKRAKLISRKNNFFASTLPLSVGEMFFVLLFNILFDYFFVIPIISLFFVNLVFENETFNIQAILTIFITIEMFFFASYPISYKIIDKDLSYRQPMLKSVLKNSIFLVTFMIFAVVIVFTISTFSTISQFTFAIDFISDYFVLSCILLVNIRCIYKIFSGDRNISNEHSKIKLNLKDWSLSSTIWRSTKSLAVLGIFVLINIFVLKTSVNTNKKAFLRLNSIGLENSPSFQIIDNNEVENLREIYVTGNFVEKEKYNWFKKKHILFYIIKTDKLDLLKVALGEDVSNWKINYCKAFEKECDSTILDKVLIHKSNKIFSFLINNKNYKIDLIKLEKHLLSAVNSCDQDLILKLLEIGVDPKVASLKKDVDIFDLLVGNRDNKCKQVSKRLIASSRLIEKK